MFFDVFRELCESRGISPKRATTDMGLSNSIAAKWKRTGAMPNGETLNKIAEYFGVTTDYLLGNEKAPTLEGGRNVSREDLKIGLFGGDGEVTDEMWEEAIFAAQLIKERHKRKKQSND